MKQEILTVKENIELNPTTYKLVLSGVSEKLFAGQFVEVKLENHFLRRPFGVADFSGDELTILYKVVGLGTEDMTKLVAGDKLDVLIGLGNHFDLTASTRPVLIAGGIGLAPLYLLAKNFFEKGIKPRVILGFRNKNEVFFSEEFQKIADVVIVTDDGSVGVKGNVIDGLKTLDSFDKYYACGPMVMLKALSAYSKDGYLSLEARMGCGFGACMGCSIKTTSGNKRVCKEGPIFEASEVIYD